MEVCDYITIDVSGPEQLGMQDMYEGNQLGIYQAFNGNFIGFYELKIQDFKGFRIIFYF